MDSEALLSALMAIEPSLIREEKSDLLTVTVAPELLMSVCSRLQAAPFRFDFLLTHTAVHWPTTEQVPGQFELLYHLYSTTERHHLLVTTRVPTELPVVDSVSELWRTAEWQEREVYDLFGVQYRGHQDLRRLFLDDDWEGFPLRKDYRDDFMLEGPE